MKEVYKEITDFEGYYVSNKGNVKLLRRLKCGRFTEKILAVNPRNQSVRLRRFDNSYRTIKVAHLVARAFLSEKPAGRRRIKHKDGNERNNIYKNLSWDGLSTKDVIQIREAIANGVSSYKIAKRYNINRTHVKRIVEKKSWKNI